MVKIYRKTVSLSDLWVSSNDRCSDFYVSSWQRGESPVPLLVIRLILAGVALGILSWSLVQGLSPYWLIFLTNWGVLLVAMTMCSSLVVSFAAFTDRSSESKDLPWYVSIYWLLFNITVTLSIMITALYWILLYDPEQRDEMETSAFWLDVTTHGITSVLSVCELLLSRTPLRILHIYHPLGLSMLYAIFSWIYYVAGGTDALGNPFIYAVLDWRQPRQVIVIISVSVLGLLGIYVIVWSLALCREKMSSALVRTTSHDLPILPTGQHARIA